MNRPLRQQMELVLSLAKRDLKSRYKESVLGFFWSLFRPAFLTLILWAVFEKILEVPFRHDIAVYWIHVLISVLVWNFLIGSLADAMNSILANSNLLKKVKLDAEVFPLAAILSNAVHFAMALGVALVAVMVWGGGLHRYLFLLPVLLGILTLFIAGLAFYLAAFNVYYRDVSSAFELVAMAWFYVTPIIYPLQVAEEKLGRKLGPGWFSVYMLNPMAALLASIRRVILYGPGEGEISHKLLMTYLAIATGMSLVLAVSGWLVFRRMSEGFTDEI